MSNNKKFDFSGLNLGQKVEPKVETPQTVGQGGVGVAPQSTAPQAVPQSKGVVPLPSQAPSQVGSGLVLPDLTQDSDDFGSLELEKVEFGKSLFQTKFERLKPIGGTTLRLGFMLDHAYKTEVHFEDIEGLRGFICFRGDCCKYGSEPITRALLPVLVYETNKAGGLTSQEAELKVLVLGSRDYNALLKAYQLGNTTFTKSDVLMTAQAQGQWVTLSWNLAQPVGPQAATAIHYMHNAQEHLDYLAENIDFLYQAAGRKITPEFYTARRAQAQDNVEFTGKVASETVSAEDIVL